MSTNLYDKETRHESFGLISVNRTQSGQGHRMCGTDLQPNQTIRIVIMKNCVETMSEHSGKSVQPGKGSYADRIEVEMTYSQYSNLICSMNYGDGTPCNVLHWSGEAVEQLKEASDNEYEFFYKKVMDELKGQDEKYVAAINDILPLIEKLPKTKQEEILKIIRALRMNITDSVPFFVKRCQEASESIVNRAKTEISGFVDSAVRSVGVKTIMETPMNAQNLLGTVVDATAEEVDD